MTEWWVQLFLLGAPGRGGVVRKRQCSALPSISHHQLTIFTVSSKTTPLTRLSTPYSYTYPTCRIIIYRAPLPTTVVTNVAYLFQALTRCGVERHHMRFDKGYGKVGTSEGTSCSLSQIWLGVHKSLKQHEVVYKSRTQHCLGTVVLVLHSAFRD